MMATEATTNIDLLKSLLKARAIAIKIAMEDADSNLFRLAVMGFDIRMLDVFKTMTNKLSDEIFMVNAQLAVAGLDEEKRIELRDRSTALSIRQAMVEDAIRIWETNLIALTSPDYRVNFDKGTLSMLAMVEEAQIMESGI